MSLRAEAKYPESGAEPERGNLNHYIECSAARIVIATSQHRMQLLFTTWHEKKQSLL